MNTTSLTLLDRLRNAPADSPDWRYLHDLYLPLIQFWLRRVPSIRDEADDLAQNVFVILVGELPSFERQRPGSFRSFLRKITLNRIRDFQRTRRKRRQAAGDEEIDHFLTQLEDPASDLSRQWDAEHDKHVLPRLLAVVKGDFTPTTWEAFTRYALDDRPPAEVAEELGMSLRAVIEAKSRILKRLREVAGDLVD